MMARFCSVLTTFLNVSVASVVGGAAGVVIIASSSAQESIFQLNLPMRATVWDASVSLTEGDEQGAARLAVISADGVVALRNLDRFDSEVEIFPAPPRGGSALEEPIRARGVALTSDGSTLAYSSPSLIGKENSAQVYLVTLSHSVPSIDQTIAMAESALALAFSPDGRFLAAALRNGYGVDVYDTKTQRWIYEMEAPDPSSRGSSVRDVIFLQDSRTLIAAEAASEDDSKNRIYVLRIELDGDEATLRRTSEISPPTMVISGEEIVPKPSSLSVHPDERRVAVGYLDRMRPADKIDTSGTQESDSRPRIDIFELRKSKLQGNPKQIRADFRRPEAWSVVEGIPQVSWSRSGKYLYAAGYFHAEARNTNDGRENKIPYYVDQDKRWRNSVLRWTDPVQQGGEVYLPAGLDTVMALAPYGEDGIIVATQDPIIAAFNGEETLARTPAGGALLELPRSFDFRGRWEFSVKLDGLAISICPFPRDKGKRVEFDYTSKVPQLVVGGECQNLDPDPKSLYENIYVSNDVAGWQRTDVLTEGKTYADAVQLGAPPITPDRIDLQVPNEGRSQQDIFWAMDPVEVVEGRARNMLVGSSNYLRVFSEDGKPTLGEAVREIRHEARRVNSIPAADGRGYVFVVAHADGVIRWYRWTGSGIPDPYLNLYIVREEDGGAREWIMWSSSGLFDYQGSDLTELLSSVDNDRTYKKKLFGRPATELRSALYCPGVVRSIMAAQDENIGISNFVDTMPEETLGCDIFSRMKTANARISRNSIREAALKLVDDTVRVETRIRMPAKYLFELTIDVDDPKEVIDRVRVVSNGETNEWPREKLTSGRSIILGLEVSGVRRCKGHLIEYDVLAYGKNAAGDDVVVAYDKGEFENLLGDECEERPRRLVAIVVASNYPDTGRKLGGAVADAEAFIQLLCEQTQQGFWKSAYVYVVGPEINEEATQCATDASGGVVYQPELIRIWEVGAIVDALTRGASKLHNAEMESDKYMYVFLAGHGGGPRDANVMYGFQYLVNPNAQFDRDKYLTFGDVASNLAQVPGFADFKSYIFIDACRRTFDKHRPANELGNWPADEIVRKVFNFQTLDLDGLYFAAQPNGVALECKLGVEVTPRGAFTRVLLKGLRDGPAASIQQREVPYPGRPDLLHPRELEDHLWSELPNLCDRGGQQINAWVEPRDNPLAMFPGKR